MLGEAIKELQAQVTAVKDYAAALKQDNNNLKSQLNDICSSGCANLKGANSNEDKLLQNVPNPFSGETTISYILNTGTTGYININTLDGKIIKHIELSATGAGSVALKASEMSAGTYTYSLYVNSRIVDTKIMVIASDK